MKRFRDLRKRTKFGIVLGAMIALLLAPTFLDPRDPNDYIGVEDNTIEDGTNKVEKEIPIEVSTNEVEQETHIEESGRDNIVGVSNKDIKDITKQKPTKVRNDSTGNWRITTLSKICNIEEYALSYYENNFQNSKEVHAIVNFANKTTTRINDLGSFLSISIMEYVDNEEHDANELFTGMELKEYFVYKDNGEIEEIKSED